MYCLGPLFKSRQLLVTCCQVAPTLMLERMLNFHEPSEGAVRISIGIYIQFSCYKKCHKLRQNFLKHLLQMWQQFTDTGWRTKCHTIDCARNTFLLLQKHLTSGTELILIGSKGGQKK